MVQALDYLVPSIEAQDVWLRYTGRDAWSDKLALVVAEHHRLSGHGPTWPYAPPPRSYIFFKCAIPMGTLRAIRTFRQPGFLRPDNALVRSGHKGPRGGCG